MSTPSTPAADGTSTPQTVSGADDTMGDILRRPMRVKVLYTFDDQNKSNCLARLPNAVNVPVVSLDETTQVGVIELKTCIQAIVAASPELVAKLGHDYTVYAYDFSEYETPLVGQGMLSWILASASSTPNAPADESQTMVTGRVCKNILGLFSNGVKETLEVKLKLVPVPTSMQKEYVENMERYHSLSQLMPEGLDYSAWADFLKENPTLGQLAQPSPAYPAQPLQRASTGGIEALHNMLTRKSPSQDMSQDESFPGQPNRSFDTQQSRASSPAMSTISFRHYQHNDSRPVSRGSVRSEGAFSRQNSTLSDNFVYEQQDDGPPRKRAKIIQTKRPKHTSLTAHNDSLRVTASTAASVRLHRPVAGNSASALASAELIPRAPTPRPGDVAFGQRGSRRPPAPSALRHASLDSGRPYMSPYDASSFSDTAMDSADDERGMSPEDTPMDMPSSPPIARQRIETPLPSSPVLPTLPLSLDSGFVSDIHIGREDINMDLGDKIWEGSDLPTIPETRSRPRNNRSRQVWQQVNPGPVDRLPQSYVPKPRQYNRTKSQPITESVEQNATSQLSLDTNLTNDDVFSSFTNLPLNWQEGLDAQLSTDDLSQYNVQTSTRRLEPTDSFPFEPVPELSPQPTQSAARPKVASFNTAVSQASPPSECDSQVYSRSATPNLLPPKAKGKGLARSQTWSGTGEPPSDTPNAPETSTTRSGGHAKRKKHIKDKMEKAIAAGEMPNHCANCGEIDTPTWRKAYTRIENGSPEGIELSTDTTGTGIITYEVIQPTIGSEGEQKYRIFKNNLDRDEKLENTYETLNLCNPCGLWLIKKCAMRPQKQWEKPARMVKRKRDGNPYSRGKSMSREDDLASDAIMPHSEPVMPDLVERYSAVVDGTVDGSMPPPPARERALSFQASVEESDIDTEAAQVALRRAIQSSPGGFRGSRDSPINVDPDLTPKPTRRILFPSPRKDGEVKTLSDGHIKQQTTPPAIPQYVPELEKPRACQRCRRLKKGCDRERPCKRCADANIDASGCIPCDVPKPNYAEQTIVQIASIEENIADKENLPPPPLNNHDEDEDRFADLFEDSFSPHTTPKKDVLLSDLLKTPTPGSRRCKPLTPRAGTDNSDNPVTPSRTATPRSQRALTETPFTRHLKALMYSTSPTYNNFSSPSQGFDFSLSAFPAGCTPGRNTPGMSYFLNDDFLSSDMPLPSSSPPRPTATPLIGGSALGAGLGFDLYEDPETASMGLWNGGGVFGVEIGVPELDDGASIGQTGEMGKEAGVLKINVGGMTVDFAGLIEGVVGGGESGDVDIDADGKERGKSTPEEPVVE